MKKCIITSTCILLALVTQAQWFVGGGFDYRFTSVETMQNSDFSRDSYSGFSFAPMFGYQKNRFAIGTEVVFANGTHIDTVIHHDSWLGIVKHNIRVESTFWGIQPFIRYTFAEFGNFSVVANIRLHLLGGRRNYPLSIGISSHNGNIFHDSFLSSFTDRQPSPWWPYPPPAAQSNYSISSFGFNIVPVLSYRLSEKISIEATFNFVNFGLNRLVQEHKHSEEKQILTDFGIGLNFENAINVEALSIGFIYRFGEYRTVCVLMR